jgi:NADPH:quinone reductase-like Zn-dependent oxidoreductase
MRRLLNKRAWIGGTVMRARSTAEKIDVARAFAEEALDALADGRLRPLVDDVLPWSTQPKRTPAWRRTPRSARSCCRWHAM